MDEETRDLIELAYALAFSEVFDDEDTLEVGGEPFEETVNRLRDVTKQLVKLLED